MNDEVEGHAMGSLEHSDSPRNDKRLSKVPKWFLYTFVDWVSCVVELFPFLGHVIESTVCSKDNA